MRRSRKCIMDHCGDILVDVGRATDFLLDVEGKEGSRRQHLEKRRACLHWRKRYPRTQHKRGHDGRLNIFHGIRPSGSALGGRRAACTNGGERESIGWQRKRDCHTSSIDRSTSQPCFDL